MGDRDVNDGDRKRVRSARRGVRTRVRTQTRIDDERGVFMISVAAELADMHPQTLRMYEARGLITPQRSPKNTRLYSQADVERLRRIQSMTNQGLNLAGVETVLEMEGRVERMRAELTRMKKRAAQMEKQMSAELERLRASSRGGEIVPYGAYDPKPPSGKGGVHVPIRRKG